MSSANGLNLDQSKILSSGNGLNAGKIKIFVFERVKNIVGKGKNSGYQHFLLFPQLFQRPSLSGLLNVLKRVKLGLV